MADSQLASVGILQDPTTFPTVSLSSGNIQGRFGPYANTTTGHLYMVIVQAVAGTLGFGSGTNIIHIDKSTDGGVTWSNLSNRTAADAAFNQQGCCDVYLFNNVL